MAVVKVFLGSPAAAAPVASAPPLTAMRAIRHLIAR